MNTQCKYIRSVQWLSLHRKKNQNKGEIEGKRKDKNEVVREMYASCLSNVETTLAQLWKTSGLIVAVLSVQYRFGSSITFREVPISLVIVLM